MAGNIEQFLEKHADADGNVSDEAMAKLLMGGATEGETAAAPAADTGAPDAGNGTPTQAPAAAPAAPAPAPAAQAPAPAPAAPAAAPSDPNAVTPAAAPAAEGEPAKVILAKDGVHTIEYQKLVDAREEARLAKAEADALRAQLTARSTAPAAPPAPAAAPSSAAAPAAELFGDRSDAAIKKGVDDLIAQAVSKATTDLRAELEPVKQEQAKAVATEHYRTIYQAHPDTDSIVESSEFQQWIDAQPAIVRSAYQAVCKEGNAVQVVEMLDTYKAARIPAATAPAPAPAPAAAPAVDPQKKADQIIAAVQPKTPVSLSDIPAGTQAPHDEVAAMAEMSPLDLMGKFEGKSPSQIEALMRRLV